ncbi:DUF294 nucleotidyltransferase-like domain-containing protein [Thaumasiovibrio subtropicus]|uniref:DUF294 nucleotidyltransferase-like domain-containing protein n=1 Tax=Thaumasiovibrio subtropicus TaxID=1891207 RepID=UPI000B360F72|nr:DUF294 nucleotidyltransferase-like domain-containing protein [Thaumasiovibrio subtropicus]
MTHTLLTNVLDFLVQIDPFDQLPADVQKEFAKSIKITYLAKGEQIAFSATCEDRYLYIIRKGSVEQRKSDGRLRAKLGEEDLFGFTFLEPLANAEDGYTVTASENALLYLVPHVQIQQLLQTQPEYATLFAAQAQVRLQSALNVVWSEQEKGIFVKRVEDVASGRIATVQSTESIRDVAKAMRRANRSSTALVYENEEIVGLITDRDLTMRVIAGEVPLDTQVCKVMTSPALTIGPNELVLNAVSLMMQHNVRSLPVVKDNQALGLLTTTHLVQKNRVQALFLIEKIKFSNTIDELAILASERQAIFEALVEGRVSAEIIGQVMTLIMDAFNRRIIQISEEKLGPPPVDYAWVVAGSTARHEVHMLSDQDNAIVFDDAATDADRIYFQHLASMVCNGLDACGYPLCSGKFMAATPKWCQPMKVWKAYYSKWVANPHYEMLLNATVFLEVRTIYGKAAFSTELQRHLFSEIGKGREFLASMMRDSVSVNPPLGIFNNLVVEKGGENSNTLNIKKFALTLIVDLARIYGLQVGSEKVGTEARFQCAYEKGAMSESMLKDIIGAYRFVSQVRYIHQLKSLKSAEIADNNIDPSDFSSFERKHLKDAFRIIANLQDAAKLRFGVGGR